MNIEVLTRFKVINGRLHDAYVENLSFNNSQQLKDVLLVSILYVVNDQPNRLYLGYAKADLFDVQNLYYINEGSNSKYIYLLGDDTKFNVLSATNANTLPSRYPYHIIREYYNVSAQNIRFVAPEDDENVSTQASLLKYTFGIEFETAGGVIPENKCFELGLVPLRDGSISGIEYATIPLNYRHIDLLRRQIQCLKMYTTTNDTCSMHMHFGRLPQSLQFQYILYRVFCMVQREIEGFMPSYTFYTERYKGNGKSYCKLLPESLSIGAFYNWLSGGEYNLNLNDAETDLCIAHPHDNDGHHKWNIESRYYALNFINAVFYNRNKTVEFRFLKPSYNINFVVNWLYLFTAIIKVAEMIFTRNKVRNMKFSECQDFCNKFFREYTFTLSDCANMAFERDPKIVRILNRFIANSYTVTKLQRYIGDNIGLKTQFHDLYFKQNPIGE